MEFPRLTVAAALVAGAIAAGGPASSGEAPSCPGHPGAVGTSRVIAIGAKDHARLGLMQYRHSLPLKEREVVLTFDDGPLPPYTDRVLSVLAQHCVKATFFLVGRHAAANPDAVLRIAEAGHTIGNHSQNHIIHFDQIAASRAEKEVEAGRRTLDVILAGRHDVAPFFRIPGLGRTRQVERYAMSRSLVVWSADAVADDWTPIGADQVLKRALSRLEARGKGILLLHDIQPRTVLMLPGLLAELKRRDFRIVHVVPERAGPPSPPDLPPPLLLASRAAPKLGWPRVAAARGSFTAARLALPAVPEPPDLGAQPTAAIDMLARATAIRALRLASGAPPEAEAPAVSPLRIAAASGAPAFDVVPLPPRRRPATVQRPAKPDAAVAAVSSRHDAQP